MKRFTFFLILLLAVVGCTLDTDKNKSTATPNPTASATGIATVGAGNQVQVFLIALEDNGTSGPAVGCGDSAVAVNRDVALPSDIEGIITTALGQLFSIHDQTYGEFGLYNALYQAQLAVDSVVLDEAGHATVNLSGTFSLSGVCEDARFRAQIEETIRQFPEVTGVSVLINGEALEDIVSGQGS